MKVNSEFINKNNENKNKLTVKLAYFQNIGINDVSKEFQKYLIHRENHRTYHRYCIFV